MPTESEGLVVATYGRRFELRLHGRDDTVHARIKGRKLRPVCGDRVTASPIDGEDDWLIVNILKRRNELTRPNQRGVTEVLAANLDFIAVTCAPLPRPDWYVVDRYLCAAELMSIPAAVVFNKVDDGHADAADQEELSRYRELDYEVVECSAKTNRNIEVLAGLLRGRTAIIVGQSGVGKSSLINRLTSADQRTAALSAGSGEGRHTTVNSVMLRLPGGGDVVDSPGVRDYAPAIAEAADVEYGFREIHRTGRECRFGNCRHRREPHCAVKSALDDGRIHARRYESYRRMLLLTEQQEKGRY